MKAAFWGGRNAGVRQTTVLLFQSCVTLGKGLNFSELSFPIHEMEVILPACRILLKSMLCLAQSLEYIVWVLPGRPIDSLGDFRSLLQLCAKLCLCVCAHMWIFLGRRSFAFITLLQRIADFRKKKKETLCDNCT